MVRLKFFIVQSCAQSHSCDTCISICVVVLFGLAVDNEGSLDSHTRGDTVGPLYKGHFGTC